MKRIPQVKENISTLRRQNADVIVAVFHWGNELEEVPDSNQTTLAHLAIDEGADLVIGHHPHILQGVEQYKGKNIAYSLGNFCFAETSLRQRGYDDFSAECCIEFRKENYRK